MSGPLGVAGDQLRAIVERIEHVEEEIKELTDAKKGNLPGSQEQRLRRKNHSRSDPAAQTGLQGARRTGNAH